MNPEFPHHDDAQAEINDPVWRLLGRAPMPQPDAWFATRTMARCRPLARRGWGAWRVALGLGLGFAVAVLALTRLQEDQVVDQQKNVQAAFDIVASVGTEDDSTTTAAPTSWQDSSL